MADKKVQTARLRAVPAGPDIRVSREFTLALISKHIQVQRLGSVAVLSVSVIAFVMFLGLGINDQGRLVSLNAGIGMTAAMVALWMVQSGMAETAARYMSLFHSVANKPAEEKVRPSLYIRRPVPTRMSAMWTHPESIFYIAAILCLAILTFRF